MTIRVGLSSALAAAATQRETAFGNFESPTALARSAEMVLTGNDPLHPSAAPSIHLQHTAAAALLTQLDAGALPEAPAGLRDEVKDLLDRGAWQSKRNRLGYGFAKLATATRENTVSKLARSRVGAALGIGVQTFCVPPSAQLGAHSGVTSALGG